MATEETNKRYTIEQLIRDISEPITELVKTVIDDGKLDKHVEVLQKKLEELGLVDYDLFITDNGREVQDLVKNLKEYANDIWNMVDIVDVIFKEIYQSDGTINVEKFKDINNLTDLLHTSLDLYTILEKTAAVYDILCVYHNACSENDEKIEEGMRLTLMSCRAAVGMVLTKLFFIINYYVGDDK